MSAEVTPRTLAQRSLTGVAMCGTLPVTTALVIWSSHPGQASPLPWIALACVGVVPLIVGVSIAYSSEKKLRAGLIDDRWSEQQVAEARTWLAQPSLRRWIVGSTLAWLTLLIAVVYTSKNHFGGIAGFTYLMILPATSLARLKQLVAPPSQPASRLWSKSKPLHSDHWGHQA